MIVRDTLGGEWNYHSGPAKFCTNWDCRADDIDHRCIVDGPSSTSSPSRPVILLSFGLAFDTLQARSHQLNDARHQISRPPSL